MEPLGLLVEAALYDPRWLLVGSGGYALLALLVALALRWERVVLDAERGCVTWRDSMVGRTRSAPLTEAAEVRIVTRPRHQEAVGMRGHRLHGGWIELLQPASASRPRSPAAPVRSLALGAPDLRLLDRDRARCGGRASPSASRTSRSTDPGRDVVPRLVDCVDDRAGHRRAPPDASGLALAAWKLASEPGQRDGVAGG